MWALLHPVLVRAQPPVKHLTSAFCQQCAGPSKATSLSYILCHWGQAYHPYDVTFKPLEKKFKKIKENIITTQELRKHSFCPRIPYVLFTGSTVKQESQPNMDITALPHCRAHAIWTQKEGKRWDHTAESRTQRPTPELSDCSSQSTEEEEEGGGGGHITGEASNSSSKVQWCAPSRPRSQASVTIRSLYARGLRTNTAGHCL